MKIKNTIVTNIEPIRNIIYNKNNNFSAKGYYKGKKVKVFGLMDKNQGNLLKFMSKHKDLKKYFPNLVSYDKNYAVEEWVEGKTLRELSIKKDISKYKNIIKTVVNKMLKTKYSIKTFNYIDLIFSRVNEQKIKYKKIPIKLNHNDLSLDNIILDNYGQLKIIDNEFLGYNDGWIFNLKNSCLTNEISFYEKYIDKKTFDYIWDVRTKFKK